MPIYPRLSSVCVYVFLLCLMIVLVVVRPDLVQEIHEDNIARHRSDNVQHHISITLQIDILKLSDLITPFFDRWHLRVVFFVVFAGATTRFLDHLGADTYILVEEVNATVHRDLHEPWGQIKKGHHEQYNEPKPDDHIYLLDQYVYGENALHRVVTDRSQIIVYRIVAQSQNGKFSRQLERILLREQLVHEIPAVFVELATEYDVEHAELCEHIHQVERLEQHVEFGQVFDTHVGLHERDDLLAGRLRGRCEASEKAFASRARVAFVWHAILVVDLIGVLFIMLFLIVVAVVHVGFVGVSV